MEKVIHKLVLKDEEGCEGRGDLGEKEVTADQDQGEAIDTVHERQQDPACIGDGIKAMTGRKPLHSFQVHPPSSCHLTFPLTLRQIPLLALFKEGNQGSGSYSTQDHRAAE